MYIHYASLKPSHASARRIRTERGNLQTTAAHTESYVNINTTDENGHIRNTRHNTVCSSVAIPILSIVCLVRQRIFETRDVPFQGVPTLPSV